MLRSISLYRYTENTITDLGRLEAELEKIRETGVSTDDQEFLAGDRLSIADVLLAPQLDFFDATPEGSGLIAGTALAGWLARMNQRPSMQRTVRPEVFRAAA